MHAPGVLVPMSEFWLWFLRPFGELLGVLALMVGVITIFFLCVLTTVVFGAILSMFKKRTEEK